MTNHSQLDEQHHILRYFGCEQGSFLDIGANDGRTFSNTHALALQSWSGLCVEPTPGAFTNLSLLYEQRPDIELHNVAITNADGPIKMQVASDTLVSSLDVQAPSQWRSYGFAWAEIEVDGVTFATLMGRTKMRRFDFISIDAEGHDLVILRQMNLEALGCRLLCIEHNSRFDEIRALCPGMNEVHRNGINLLMGR